MSSAMVASCTSRERTDSKIATFLVDPGGGPLFQDFHDAGIRHEHGVTRLQGTLRAKKLSAGGQSSRAHAATSVIFDDTFLVPLQEFISEEVDDSRKALRAWGVSESLCADGAWVCPACALKSSRRKEDWRRHFDRTHCRVVNGTPSTKQQRLIQALWLQSERKLARSQMFGERGAQTDERRYLHSSAQCMLDQLRRSPSWATSLVSLAPRTVHKNVTHFDEHIKLFLDSEDTRFILRQDTHRFHTLGAHCVCSDRFFNHRVRFILASRHTRSQLRVIERTKELCGWMGHLVPTDGSLWLTLREDLFAHPVIKQARLHCKGAADKVVLAIDGQYSTQVNILYQVPHGSRISETVGQAGDARVLLSVMRADSIIHLHVAPDEGIEHQRIALNSAVGDHRPRDTRLLLSDSPLNLDVPDINQDFGSLECIGSDPLHVALRLEKASNQKKNRLSKRVGPCMSELTATTGRMTSAAWPSPAI